MDKIKILKLSASWCGPCKMYAPVFEKVKSEYAYSNIEFISIDIDEEENADLLNQYSVKGVPTTIKVLEDGSFTKISGMMQEAQLKNFIGI